MTTVIRDINPKEDLKEFVVYKNLIIDFFEKHLKKRVIHYDTRQDNRIWLNYRPTANEADDLFENTIVTNPEAAIVKSFITKMMIAANCIRGQMEYNSATKSWKIIGTREYVEDFPITYHLNIPEDVWYDQINVQVFLKSKTGTYLTITPNIKNSFKHPGLDKALTNAAAEAAAYFKTVFKNKKGNLVKHSRWRGIGIIIKNGQTPKIKIPAQLKHSLSHSVEVNLTDF